MYISRAVYKSYSESIPRWYVCFEIEPVKPSLLVISGVTQCLRMIISPCMDRHSVLCDIKKFSMSINAQWVTLLIGVSHLVVLDPVRVSVPPSITNSCSSLSSRTVQSTAELESVTVASSLSGREMACSSSQSDLQQFEHGKKQNSGI